MGSVWLEVRRPPGATHARALFPYTALFRSTAKLLLLVDVTVYFCLLTVAVSPFVIAATTGTVTGVVAAILSPYGIPESRLLTVVTDGVEVAGVGAGVGSGATKILSTTLIGTLSFKYLLTPLSVASKNSNCIYLVPTVAVISIGKYGKYLLSLVIETTLLDRKSVV